MSTTVLKSRDEWVAGIPELRKIKFPDFVKRLFAFVLDLFIRYNTKLMNISQGMAARIEIFIFWVFTLVVQGIREFDAVLIRRNNKEMRDLKDVSVYLVRKLTTLPAKTINFAKGAWTKIQKQKT